MRTCPPVPRFPCPSTASTLVETSPASEFKAAIFTSANTAPLKVTRYDRLIAEFIANGRRLPAAATPETPGAKRSVDDVLLAFWQFAEGYYVKDGEPTKELVAFKYAMRAIRTLYGSTLAASFGPLALKAVREHLINQDLCRTQVNARVNRIKRIFKWAVSEELVPPGVFEGLRTVAGLRMGRSRARESEPVKPVVSEHVQAVLPYVSPQVAAMIQLQLLTGMRAGEVVIMRPSDLDRTDDIWIYVPAEHKTAHRGFHRQVPLGAKAQAILLPFLSRGADAYLFSPQEAEAWRNERRAEYRSPNRKTKIYPSELRARTSRKQRAKDRTSLRAKRVRFDVDSYRRAITYGIKKAKKSGVAVPHWHPHQLRHTFATDVRRKYGVEGAQVALGHSRADVTQVYAERNLTLASRIAKEIG